MPQTTRLALPYPAGTDPANVPVDMQELADRLAAIAAGWLPPGTAAARPAPAAALDRHLYFAHDTSEIFACVDAGNDGSYAWVKIYPPPSPPPPISDHGALTGLGDDDHPHYLTTTRHDTTARHGSSVVDHGSIGGLADDDHPQYVLGNQSTVKAGSGASAGSAAAVVLGNNASGISSSIAIGNGASTPGDLGAMALGFFALAGGNTSVAIGRNASAPNADQGVLGVASGFGPKNWLVPGTFSVTGTKNFEIPHPDDPGRTIRHGSYEGPVPGGTVYRYRLTVDTDGGTATQQLPDYFTTLNADIDVHVSPVGHFGRAYGEVTDDILTITGETAGEYAVLILGTRDDPAARKSWELYQDVKPAGVTWSGDTSTIEVEESIA